MNDIKLEISFNHELNATFIITKTNDGFHVEDKCFSNISKVEESLPQFLDSIRTLLPNIIIFTYSKLEIELYSQRFEVFGEEYIKLLLEEETPADFSEAILKPKITEIKQLAQNILKYFSFMEKHADKVFEGHFMQWECPEGCNYPIFFDKGYDAMLCFECNKWIEQPEHYDEDNPPPQKPSGRIKTLDLTKTEVNYQTKQKFRINFNYKNQLPDKYVLVHNGLSVLSLTDHSTGNKLSINSIPELLRVIPQIIEKKDIVGLKNISINLDVRRSSGLMVSVSITKDMTKEDVSNKLILSLGRTIIDDQIWLNPT